MRCLLLLHTGVKLQAHALALLDDGIIALGLARQFITLLLTIFMLPESRKHQAGEPVCTAPGWA